MPRILCSLLSQRLLVQRYQTNPAFMVPTGQMSRFHYITPALLQLTINTGREHFITPSHSLVDSRVSRTIVTIHKPISVDPSISHFGNTQPFPSCIHGPLQFCTVCNTAPNPAHASTGHPPSPDPQEVLDYCLMSYKQLTSVITQSRKHEPTGRNIVVPPTQTCPWRTYFLNLSGDVGLHDFRSSNAGSQWGNGLDYPTAAKPAALTASKAFSSPQQKALWGMPQGFNGANIDPHQFSAHSSTHLPYYARQQGPRNPFWPSELPARTAAAEALNMLTDICHQTMPEWADGMLLAGCLTYALGDFQNSLQWNSRILELEPK